MSKNISRNFPLQMLPNQSGMEKRFRIHGYEPNYFTQKDTIYLSSCHLLTCFLNVQHLVYHLSSPTNDNIYPNDDDSLFYIHFNICFYLGFTALSSNISLNSSRSFIKGGRKPENLGKNHLTARKQNLAFPRDQSEARTTASVVTLFNSFIPEFLKWTLPSLESGHVH